MKLYRIVGIIFIIIVLTTSCSALNLKSSKDSSIITLTGKITDMTQFRNGITIFMENDISQPFFYSNLDDLRRLLNLEIGSTYTIVFSHQGWINTPSTRNIVSIERID